LEVGGCFGVAVQDHPAGRERDRPRYRDLPSRADIQRQPLLGNPLGHRPAQECLAGVRHFGARERFPVDTAPLADLGFVEDVSGRAVPGGQRVQPHTADGQLTGGAGPCGGGPYRGRV